MPIIARWTVEDLVLGFNGSEVIVEVRNKVRDEVKKVISEEVNEYCFNLIDNDERFYLRDLIRHEMDFYMDLGVEFYKNKGNVVENVLRSLR